MSLYSRTKKAVMTIAIMIVCMNILLWLGLFDSTKDNNSIEVENQLRLDSDAGNSESQNKLGTLLFKRAKKTKGDFADAIYWFEQANKQEHPFAQMNLAFAYRKGQGVAINNEKAIELFYASGINFLRTNLPDSAKDSVYNINRINSIHPLKRKLIDAIKQYESTQ
jgi:TPR repeat protein